MERRLLHDPRHKKARDRGLVVSGAWRLGRGEDVHGPAGGGKARGSSYYAPLMQYPDVAYNVLHDGIGFVLEFGERGRWPGTLL